MPHSSTSTHEAQKGLAFGLAAFVAWGLFPIYFHEILTRGVSAVTLVAHRIVWAVPFLLIIVLCQRQWRALVGCFRFDKTAMLLLGSTVMIALNWFVFAYAIEHKQVLQAGLGYYINPLVNVLLGAIVLRERLRRMQIVSVCLAGIGVGVQAYSVGAIQWIPLALAGSFGVYGLLRKTMSVGPLVGLTFETILLFPVAIWLALQQLQIDFAQPHDGRRLAYGLMLFSGMITAMPLLWFSAGARRLRLSTVGFLQYLAPTIQTSLAVWYMHEPFKLIQLLTFGFIWVGLATYSVDTWRAMQSARADRAVLEAESRREAAAAAE